MSEPKFTKGKWSVGIGKLEGGVVDEQDELICDPSGGRFEEEAKANASLIAAAPEMYALLEDLLDRFRNDEFAPEIEKLLKKARGEE